LVRKSQETSSIIEKEMESFRAFISSLMLDKLDQEDTKAFKAILTWKLIG